MIRILFITDNFPPEVNAPATRTFEHCREWVKNGAEVTVITCFPNFPQGKVYASYKNKWKQKEIIDGINVIRVWSYITANKGFFKRIIDYMSFSFLSFLHLLFARKDYSIIIATSPQFFTGLTAMIISFLKRVPWVFEVRDLWPEGIITLQQNSFVYRSLERLEKKYYKSAKGIVPVTISFKKDILERFKIPENKFKVIYNGVNNSNFQINNKDEQLLRKLNLNNKFLIGYAGTLGLSHSLDFVVECFSELEVRIPQLHLLLIGSGAMQTRLKDMIVKKKCKNITLLPPVTKKDVSRYISLFDIGLVPLKKVDAYLKVIPSKIFELAAMKKPILLGVDGESRGILEKYNAGVYFEPENSNSFKNVLIGLYDDRNNLNKYHYGLNKMSIDFERKNLAIKMLTFLKEIDNENNNN